MQAQELFNQAWELKKTGNLMEALKLYSKLFEILTAQATDHAHAQSGSFIDKMENGKKIRIISPKMFNETSNYLKKDKVAATISNNMAVIFAELGDFEAAKKFFEQAIELTPVDIDYPDPKIGLQELSK